MNKLELQSILDELNSRKSEWEAVDIKRELKLESSTEKFEFIKDIIAMGNNQNGGIIIIGLEDKTFKITGLQKGASLSSERLNQIIAGRIDPLPSVEYQEFQFADKLIGCISITGNNRPYMCIDKFENYRHKGKIYLRQSDITEVCWSRANLDYISSFNKCRIEYKITKVESGSGCEIHVALHNKDVMVAKNIRLWLSLNNGIINKCPTGKHGHADTRGHNKSNNILVDIESLHNGFMDLVLKFNINIKNDIKFLVKIVGHNVVEINEEFEVM